MPAMSTTSATPAYKDYEFEFEKVFTHPQTKPLFLQQVKKELNEENTNFIAAIDMFKTTQQCKKSHGEALFATYIKHCAPQEVNLSAKTKQAITDIIQQQENAQVWPSTLFDDAYAQILLNLKVEVFSRFQRSKFWHDFVQQADAKLLKQVGTHKSDIVYLYLNGDDFARTEITDKDLQITKMLYQDYTFWIPLSNDNHIQNYMSTKCFCDESAQKIVGYMNILKMTNATLIDLPAQDLIRVLSCPEYLAPEEKYEMLEHIPASETCKYAHSIYKWFAPATLFNIIKSREFLTTNAVIYDPEEQTYHWIARSCSYGTKYKPKLKHLGHCFRVVSAKQVSATQSMVMAIGLVNPHGWIEAKNSASAFDRAAHNAILKIMSNNVVVSVKKYLASSNKNTTDFLGMHKSMQQNMQLVTKK